VNIFIPSSAVIGPLIITGVSIDLKQIYELKKIRIKDSKELSPKRRESLAKHIERIAKDIIVLKTGPCKIDNYRKQGINLNKLETIKFAEIINYLKPDMVYVDAHDVNISKLEKILNKMIKVKTKLVVEHYADKKYPIVSAASIISKVERDAEIEKLKNKHGDIGSGYPSDPITINWLENWLEKNKKFPDFVRKTWITAEILESEHKQSKLHDFFKKLVKLKK
jgi:ribonuclease HII